jgi:hypothetical protein
VKNKTFPIVNFTFICSNIPAGHAYGVYISQLIRYSRACCSYHACLYKGLALTRQLLNQWLLVLSLKSSLRKLFNCQIPCFHVFSSVLYDFPVETMFGWSLLPFENHIGAVMVNVLTDRVKPKTGMCCFSDKHATLI